MKILVAGGDNSVESMVKVRGHTPVLSFEEDVAAVILTGGSDISPQLYGEKNTHCYSTYPDRDWFEIGVAMRAKRLKLPILGICRGAQLLNVLNGGSMWQDCDGHAGTPHKAIDEEEKKEYWIASVHHQMMIPAEDARIIGTAKVSTFYRGETGEYKPKKREKDVEVLWYEKTKSLCFQSHPEYRWNGNEATEWFWNLTDKLTEGVIC